MKFTAALIVAAGVSRVSATGGVGVALCLAACLPLVINPIAYTACTTGCSVMTVSEEEIKASPRFLPDGTVVFEKESPRCAEACKPLVADALSYSSCLAGCGAVIDGVKN